MNKNELINSATRAFHKVVFATKKHSPEILITAGVAGTITSTIMACKATTKADAVLEEMHENMSKIHHVAETAPSEKYTEEDLKKDTALVYVQTGVKFVKLYGPAVLLGAASLTCIVSSHNILRKRNIALAAAYATVDKGFKDYRNRVVERFGNELDKELRYNIKAKEFEEITVDEKGKEKVTKKTVNVADPNVNSDYARFFDESCVSWSKDPEYNLIFLKQQQNWANDMLRQKGHLYLNEVYDMIGIPRTKAGQIVGWIYDEKCPVGDNFVDFGIYDAYSEKARDFVNGYERSILLDFNVDGNILNMM